MTVQGAETVVPESAWFKSSYSSGGGGECVEVALTPAVVHVRDSKVGAEGPRFGVAAEAWDAFLTAL